MPEHHDGPSPTPGGSSSPNPAVGAARRVSAAAWARGDGPALETEALEVVRTLGIGVPRSVTVPDAAAHLDLDGLPGDRVVVKVLGAGVVHKTDVGGVRVVPNEPAAVRTAMDEMPAAGNGFLIEEYVPHEAGPAGELLLGIRWTDEFGPVVIFGPGGAYAEFLASHGPGGVAVLSPLFPGPEAITAALDEVPVVRLLVEGYREQRPLVAQEALVDLLTGVLDFAAAVMPADVQDFEVNPLVFTPDGPVALDAVLRPGPAAPSPAAPDRPPGKIRHLLEPRSIAIVGVSERMNPGRVILANILRAGFPRECITVVKPGRDSIDGCACVPSLSDLPDRSDLLVLSIDAGQVPVVVGEAIDRRAAESIVLIPGGLGERAGTEAAAEEIAARIRASRSTGWGGPVVNGGNSLGIRSAPGRYDTFFIPAHKLTGNGSPRDDHDPVAVVSQSGALTLSRLDRLPWLRSRYVVSVGNQIDLTVGDYLEHFAGDPEIDVVACYVEGFRPGDGARWLEAAARMTERGGAVILYRAGRTPAGAHAALTHTAAVAGDYTVTTALARRAGVLVADTLADFEDLLAAAVLLRNRRVEGLRLGAFSNAGFECVALADNLGPLQTGPFSAGTIGRLETLLGKSGIGSIVGTGNPLDLTPAAGDALFAEAVLAVLSDRAVDVGLVGCVPFTPALQTLPPGPAHTEDVAGAGALAGLLLGMQESVDKAWVAVVDAGPDYDPLVRLLEEGGIPVFRNADRAVRIFGRYCAWRVSHSG